MNAILLCGMKISQESGMWHDIGWSNTERQLHRPHCGGEHDPCDAYMKGHRLKVHPGLRLVWWKRLTCRACDQDLHGLLHCCELQSRMSIQ